MFSRIVCSPAFALVTDRRGVPTMSEADILPPLSAESLLRLLLAVAALLLIAYLLGRVAARFGMPAIVGELLTGVILGPSLLGWIAPGAAMWLLPHEAEQQHLLDAIGQFGLLLLVALTGTHLDMKAVRKRGRQAISVSVGGLLIPLALGIGIGMLFVGTLGTDDPAKQSVFPLFLGVAMCVTAIPVIAKTLTDMNMLHRNIGQLTLAAGMIDDAVGWTLLSICTATATVGLSLGTIGLPVLYLAIFVFAAFFVGRPVVRWVMEHTIRSSDSSGPTSAAAVIVVLLGAVAGHALGMEPIFGAFVFGMLIATAGSKVQERLAPLRTVVLSVLAPLFMATAGLRMDLTELARPEVLVAALVVLAVAIIGKFLGAYIGARLSGLTSWEGLALGAGMNSRGVVEVVVALTGLRLGVIDVAGYTVIVLVAVVTSLMAPPTLRWAMKHVKVEEEETLRGLEHDSWAGKHVDPLAEMIEHNDDGTLPVTGRAATAVATRPAPADEADDAPAEAGTSAPAPDKQTDKEE
jgi:Kef-type K+ transport system membrane component KefB